jgi:hypothetical protein
VHPRPPELDFAYVGYGLQVRSAVRLPGFVEGEEPGLPEVRILQEEVAPERWETSNDDAFHIVGRAEGVMRFEVEGGRKIVVDPAPGVDSDYVRAIVSGELMATLLRQRGMLALHGSCVARDDYAVGFIGHSGWGKSTLAMHFVQCGYRLLCDDVLAVEFEGKEPSAVPGYPQVKLRGDSGERFVRGDEFEGLPTAHSETDKRLYVCGDQFQDVAVPLRKLYILEGHTRAQNEIVSLSRRQAFVELLRHTRASNLLKSDDMARAHLEQLSALLEVVPVSLLHRRRSLDLLPELYALIERDVERSSRSVAGP